MQVTAFDMDAPLDERRIIVRYGEDGAEMVELPWGLRPRERGGRPFTLVRSEDRTFPSHRCLVPASEFRLTRGGRRYTFSMADGNWFYFAGIWRPASADWPEAYAVLTIDANADVAPYHDRQMAVLRRVQRMEWLELSRPESELLRPLPVRTFQVERVFGARPAPSRVEARRAVLTDKLPDPARVVSTIRE
jgi:putative SOS response-associated peptidase YedK